MPSEITPIATFRFRIGYSPRAHYVTAVHYYSSKQVERFRVYYGKKQEPDLYIAYEKRLWLKKQPWRIIENVNLITESTNPHKATYQLHIEKSLDQYLKEREKKAKQSSHF